MAKHLSLALSVLLANLVPGLTTGRAEVLDIECCHSSTDSRLMALDDTGVLWRLSNSCDDWRFVETFPGARCMGWDGQVGAIVTDAEMMFGNVSGLDFETWSPLVNLAVPAPGAIDVGIDYGNTYWIETEAGEFWI